MHLDEVIIKATKLIAEGKALGKDTRPLEERLKVLEGGLTETTPTLDQVSLWTLSQLAKRNMAIEIYSEILDREVWLCSNELMVLQVKEDYPDAVTYTVDEMRELIRLNPTPEDIKRIYDAKSVLERSRIVDSMSIFEFLRGRE